MSVLKLGLHVEGSDDKAFIVPLAARVLSLSPSNIEVRLKGKCVSGIKHNLKSVLKEFHIIGCTHVLVCADNHNLGSGDRARIIREAHETATSTLSPIPFFVSVAIEGLEAWIIAHYTILNTHFGIKLNQPPKVEAIPDPKEFLHNYIQRDPKFDDWSQFAQLINVDPKLEKIESYKALLEVLAEWKQ